MRLLLTLTVTSSLAACGDGMGASTSSVGSNATPATATTESSSSSTTDSSSSNAAAGGSTVAASSTSTGSSGDSSPSIWDMGSIPDFDRPPAGCEGKIDFLFVISTSGTMKFAQERLNAAVPGFIATIQEQFANFGVHVLVANSRPGWGVFDCSLCMDDCDPMGQPPSCGAMLTPCDKKLGAAVTFPAGENSSNQRCELGGNLRYIVSGQQGIEDAFACIARVGTAGLDITGQAMVAALQPEMNDPDDEYACNRGFLREDALLVVTLIQDTYDEDSLGTVDEWIEALRAAKHHDYDAFALLVLTTDVDLGYQQLCKPNDFVMYKNRLRLLAEGVDHGFIGSICMDDYVPFFAEHVGDLVELCDNFVPPG